jgi:RNA polymerase sigma-70 factor (ECF subfamily)
VTSIGLHLDSGVGTADPQADFRHDDGALLIGLQAGDNSAYEELVHKFQQPVYNLVSRLMSDPDDAGDVVQEVFLKVFRSIGSFRGQSSLKTWIYRIAVNEGYNHRRWFSRHRKQEVGLDSEIEGTRTYQDVLPDPTRSPFDSASDHETHELIERGLETLNPKFRAAVVLRDIEDLSYEEIADVLQVSLGTVKSRILRGREALREALVARMAERTSKNADPVSWWPQVVE